jgi:hypothetical protein
VTCGHATRICCCRCTHSLLPRYWANYGRKLFEFSFLRTKVCERRTPPAWPLQPRLSPTYLITSCLSLYGGGSAISMCPKQPWRHSFPLVPRPASTCASHWTTAHPLASTSPSLSRSSQSSRRALLQLVNIHSGADEVGLVMLSRAALSLHTAPRSALL